MGGSSKPKPETTKQNTTQNTATDSTTTQNNQYSSNGLTSTQITSPDWVNQAWRTNQGMYSGLVNGFLNTPQDTLTSQELARAVAQGTDPYRALPTALGTVSMTAAGDYLKPYDPSGLMEKTLAGDFLYGGDAFNRAVDASFRAGMPRVLSAFGAGGRSNGGLAKVALANAFSDPFAAQYAQERQNQNQVLNLYTDMYSAERQRQLQAAGLLPGLALTPSSIYEQLGLAQDTRSQQQMQQQLNNLAFLSPWLGNTTTTQQNGTTTGTSHTTGTNAVTGTVSGVTNPSYYPGNSFASGFGGLLSGASTGAQVGSLAGPGGTGIGALAGGLIGGIGGLFS